MIPAMHITAWEGTAPWAEMRQIEQDFSNKSIWEWASLTNIRIYLINKNISYCYERC